MNDDQITPAPATKPSAGIWPWVPFIGLVAVLIPNLTFIYIGRQLKPESVTNTAWQDDQSIDAAAAARAQFARLGLALTHHIEQGDLLLDISGDPAVTIDRVTLYRPNDATLDRELSWTDPTKPLRVDRIRAGMWRLTVTGTADGQAIRHTTTLSL